MHAHRKWVVSPFFAYTLFSFFTRDLFFPRLYVMRDTPAYALCRRWSESPPKLDDEGSLVAEDESRILQNAPWHASAVQT